MGPTGPTGYLPAATHSYLDRAATSLREAAQSPEATARYAGSHMAALRATAALLAARARPQPVSARRRVQRNAQKNAQKNAWVLLGEVAPELGEWAAFFAAGAGKRAAAEAGARGAVSEREADDLLRDAGRFLVVVEQSLGLVPRSVSPGVSPGVSLGVSLGVHHGRSADVA